MLRPPASALRRLFVVTVAVVLAACAPQAASVAPEHEVPPFTPGVVPDSFVARLTTTKGEVDIIVRRDWAPNGAAQFC